MADAIAIDGQAEGGLVPIPPNHSSVWGQYSLVWGRADARIAVVRIDLGGPLHDFDPDVRVVTASVGGGYWIGWWPDNQLARVVTGFDAQGTGVVALKLTDDGWVAQ